MKPGRYNAKIVDYSVVENDKDEPIVLVTFGFESEGKPCRWSWTGGFGSDKAKERTLKTLILMGLRSESLEDLCDGPTSNMLDMEKEFEIVLEESEYNGKKRLQIAYVNELGGSGKFGERAVKDDIKKKFGGMSLRAELSALGFKKKEQPANLDDIPF